MLFHDLVCADCKTRTIIETSHELLCKSCGLVLQDRMMQDEQEWRYFADDTVDPSRVAPMDEPIIKKSIEHHLDNMNSILQIPESVCKHGGLIFGTLDKGSKGVNRVALVYACVYYAQREMPNGARTKQEIAQYMGIDLNTLIKASYIVKEHLYQSLETRHLTQSKDNKDDTLHRMLIQVTSIPLNRIQHVKKLVHKIFSKVSSAPKIQSIQIEKVNATLIYMACNFAGIKTTMTLVANACSTSLATIIKIETIVKDLLSSSTK